MPKTAELNAVIYARYSSANQTEQSIEGQLRYCRAYAEQHGYTIVHEYIDRAQSGTTDNRPEFQQMIRDSAKKQFQFVVVWKLDRFARNRYDSAIYKNILKKNRVKVISATEVIGEGNEAIILESVLEAMAEVYSRQLSQNTQRGMRETALKGLWTGGNIPLGYQIENQMLVIDEKEASCVRTIFELYASGESKTDICRICNEKGYRTKTGKPFFINALRHILSNPVYTGKYLYKGEIVRACPRIISDELFQKCADRTELNRALRGQKQLDDVHYILTGKLFCGYCGNLMTGDMGTGRNGTRYYYYTCHRKKKNRDCQKKSEKKDFIEWYVVEQTIAYILDPARVEYIAEQIVESYRDEFSESKIEEYEKTIKRLDAELDKCVDSLLSTTNDAVIKKINARADLLEAQKKDAESELVKLRITSGVSIKKEEVVQWLKSYCKGDLFDVQFREKIIDTFINSVFLFDDKLTIYYNVKHGKQVSYIEALEDASETDSPCSDSCPCWLPLLGSNQRPCG